MRAVVYHGPGQKAWEEVPMPVILDDTDAIVRVDEVVVSGVEIDGEPAFTNRRGVGARPNEPLLLPGVKILRGQAGTPVRGCGGQQR